MKFDFETITHTYYVWLAIIISINATNKDVCKDA
jgi:hypothetical protein